VREDVLERQLAEHGSDIDRVEGPEAPPRLLERLGALLQRHPLAVLFVVVSVVVRLTFWVVTKRVWEDALITITPARNFWEGNGLTHHISEPRVHSFTSPVSVLIPLVGEGIHQGLLFLRVSSLIAGAVSVIYAYKIGLHFQWSRWAHVLVLSFLATDQLQVFFGMTGMETQVATAVMVAGVYALFTRRWQMLGVMLGLAGLCRPEFGLWIAAAGVALILSQRRAAVRPALTAVGIVAPWVVFTTWYYGSPIPHTIIAKRLYPSVSSPTFDAMRDQAGNIWKTVSPFYSYGFIAKTPFPPFLLQATTALVIGFAVYGVWHASRISLVNLAPAASVVAFYVYEVVALVPPYFMWYIPPVAAVVFIYAGIGANELLRSRRPTLAVVAVGIATMYAVHIPFTYPLEARVQRDIETAVRVKVGRYLDDHMTADDTVVLEPLGFIGWEAFNKTIYDYPGLGSIVVTDTLEKLETADRTMQRLAVELRPTYLAFRPDEWNWFTSMSPTVAAEYEVVAEFFAPATLDLSQAGIEYYNVDTHFIVARHIEG
jgi:hypothetical protein